MPPWRGFAPHCRRVEKTPLERGREPNRDSLFSAITNPISDVVDAAPAQEIEKGHWLKMTSFRKPPLLWAACMPLMLILGACSKIAPASRPVTALPTVAPVGPLTINTFPPLKNNGAALHFSHFGIEDGLSQSSARVLLQDNRGFLWIGTQDGLNRFDGYSFKVFRANPDDPYALIGSEISAILQGTDGSIWVGTNDGLNRYDPGTGKFRHWVHDDNNPDSLVNDTVQVIHQGPPGVLWVGTHQGLDEFNLATEKFMHVPLPEKQAWAGSVYSINALCEDAHGTLWIGTNDGLIGYGTVDHKFQRYQSGDGGSISFNEVSSISEDPGGMLWVGTHAGLNRLDPSSGQVTRFVQSGLDSTSLVDDFVLATYVDRAGQLWVGTRNGLDRFDPVNQQFVHYRNDPTDLASLSSNTVDSIYEDRGGVLWVGTNDGGLNEHDRNQDQFTYYHHVNAEAHSLSGDIIFPILPANGGKIWIGTYQAGLNLFDPVTGQFDHYRHDPANPDSLLSDTVLALSLDQGGTLWIGTDRGLDRLDPGSSKFVHYVSNVNDPRSLPFGSVYKIYQVAGATYWVGTSHGVRIFNPAKGEFTRIDAAPADLAGLVDGPARAIYQDRNGTIWFGTDSHGLFRLNPRTRQLKQYTNDPNIKNSLSSDTVMDVFEDSRGTIWIATFGGGLDRYLPEEDGFTQFRQEQGLPNDVVYGILEDESGHLWLSTNLGISRFDPAKASFENFTVKDGLQSNEFDSAAFAKDDHGRMYFGGIKGLTVFDPAEIKKNQYIPSVVLTSLTMQDGKPVSPAQTAETLEEATLSYPQNSFDLSFAALSFSQVEKNQYRYMLEGFDQNWHNASSDHQGSYTNLPGGTYTLRIRGSNSDGAWNDRGIAIRITIVPPFWQTWPFRGLTGTALILMAFLAYRWRVRGIQTQKIELEQIVLDRTQALKKQNLDLEALYSADEKMLRVLTQDEVLQALVDVAVDVLQADKSAIFTQAPADGEYSVRVSRGFRAETVDPPEFAESQRTILAKVAAGEPLVVSDTLNDPWWEQQRAGIVGKMAAADVRSLMYMPIKVQNTVLGVFNICSSQPNAFNEARQRLFASLVQRAALSIENGRLFEQTKHVAILEERNRLAQDLHDSAKQKAFAALAQLGAAKKLVNHDHGNAAEHLVEAENIVSEVIHDLTFFIQGSYPKDLEEKGLAVSLREYVFAWESRSAIRLNLSIVGERRLPPQIEQVLYRVVQEGLANIARHSRATQATVRMVYAEHELQIEIGDNGMGFDLTKTDGGLGLRLIHERLEGIGGHVEIRSRRGGGTQLIIRSPIQIRK